MAIEKPSNLIFEYGTSFVNTKNHAFNTPRFLIEAKCTIRDGENYSDYYLCAPCKGEHTFAKKDLFEKKSFEFTPVFGDDNTLVFRKFGFFNNNELNEYKKVYDRTELWGDKEVNVKYKEGKLLDNKSVIESTKNGKQIMGRVYFEKNGYSATIDFPVKTINIGKKKWQVDTGAIIFPDFTKQSPYQIFLFDLAFIAFNNFKSAEVIGRDLCSFGNYWIAHYCKSLTIKNPKIYLYAI